MNHLNQRGRRGDLEGLLRGRAASRRGGEGFDSVESFLQDDSLAGQGISPDGLSVQSGFFKVSVRARVDDRFGYLTSIIQRN